MFSGYLFDGESFLRTLWCTIVFTILTSSIYIFNDIIDLPRDKIHPFKSKRPIASGNLPIPIALFSGIMGATIALFLGYQFNFFFFLTLLTYLVLQISYSLLLKNIIILDVLAITSGFILRVYAGTFAINVHMSVWFLLCVVSLSLFLSVGKRRAEIAVLTEKASSHRRTLSLYSTTLLDSYLAMFANSAWLAYALFTFFAPPLPRSLHFITNLPQALAGTDKWLMITVPVVIFGIMRYMMIIYQGTRAESPEKILLSDKPLLISILIWSSLVIFILYGIQT